MILDNHFNVNTVYSVVRSLKNPEREGKMRSQNQELEENEKLFPNEGIGRFEACFGPTSSYVDSHLEGQAL